MPYRSVQFCAGEYYHFYNRGNNYLPVFFDRENYLFFLHRMREYLAAEVLDLVAYCLMPNHYHLLARLKVDNPSRHWSNRDLRPMRSIRPTRPLF